MASGPNYIVVMWYWPVTHCELRVLSVDSTCPELESNNQDTRGFKDRLSLNELALGHPNYKTDSADILRFVWLNWKKQLIQHGGTKWQISCPGTHSVHQQNVNQSGSYKKTSQALR
jgi:hypothetical protein